MSRYRLWITKRIDDKVKFIGRVGGNTLAWERYYLDVTLPWDATMWVGLWNFDWEGEDGFYNDNDAWFTDQTLYGFYLAKPFGMGQFDVFAAHNEGEGDEGYVYGTRLKFAFNEQFGMGLAGLWWNFDEDLSGHPDFATYWVQGYVNFTPDITLRGRYMFQDASGFDSTNAWQAILDVKQSVTGFTSIWIEYAQLDSGFGLVHDPYANYSAMLDESGPVHLINDTTVLFVRLDQQWNDKWATFQRYVKVDDNYQNARGWTIGVKYWYTPALSFELLYDDVDYLSSDSGSLIRLRTFVSF